MAAIGAKLRTEVGVAAHEEDHDQGAHHAKAEKYPAASSTAPASMTKPA